MIRFLVVFLLVSAGSVRSQALPTFGKSGLVVSDSDLASAAAMSTLKAGGNAADAAVTTAFVLGVTRPYWAGLGGGGFMLIRFNNEISALDYRERAPEKSTETMFSNLKPEASVAGGLSVAVPGNVKGLFELHKKFGKLPWRSDVAPAVALAKNGFMITHEFVTVLADSYSDFNPTGKKIFSLRGKPLQVGDILKQPQLALALEIIQREGANGFYTGAIAKDIVASSQATGGIITLSDLSNYQVKWPKPLHAQVFGSDIYTMPPPSSGGALILEELKLSEKLKLGDLPAYGQEQFHLMAEIIRRAFFDRQYLADPDYATVPVEKIFSDERVEKWAKTINPDKKTDFDQKTFELSGTMPRQLKDHTQTTHYVVVDSQGNAVSSTTTVNNEFGSGVVTDKYGITLNDEMDDFTTKPGTANMFGLVQGKANLVEPHKTPLSSMTPTLIEKNGKLWLAIGSPGGPTIINAVYQVTLHALTTKKDLDELVQAPRVHHQYLPDVLRKDTTLSPDTEEALIKKGHKLEDNQVSPCVYAIRVTDDHLLEGAFDHHCEGGASGY